MLTDDAQTIWRAGVAAVSTERLLQDNVRVRHDRLEIADRSWPLDEIDRVVVVGAGKAGAGMAAGLEAALGDETARAKQLAGWINVPADCVRPLRYLKLHAARPAGVNEPTEAGVEGARRILDLVSQLGPRDLCICLLSGGGSALLPAPLPDVTLADKQQVTRQLSAAGANIRQLNTVRKQLSAVKGGGLARACRAGSLMTLVISDVLGDPLDIIASGPTVPDPATPHDALEVLRQLLGPAAPPVIVETLQRRSAAVPAPRRLRGGNLHDYTTDNGCQVMHRVIGNNAVAVAAAADEARRLGYRVAAHAADQPEGLADEVGRQLIEQTLQQLTAGELDGLITGGEPVVKLAPADRRGRGGRNQQLVLAALVAWRQSLGDGVQWPVDLTLLSGGTDGEDGPTDAAGGWIDAQVERRILDLQLDVVDALARNDAYTLLKQAGGLLTTGPTHTNVCDLRVVLWKRRAAAASE